MTKKYYDTGDNMMCPFSIMKRTINNFRDQEIQGQTHVYKINISYCLHTLETKAQHVVVNIILISGRV